MPAVFFVKPFTSEANIHFLRNSEITISQVEFLVDGFRNNGDKDYDYLSDILSLSLESALKKVPFFTLTEEQKDRLISSISLQHYLFSFKGNYYTNRPLVFVKPKLETIVHRGKHEILPFSINFYGKYAVKKDKIFIDIYRSSRYIGFKKKVYTIEANIDSIIQNTQQFFLPYVKSILNYRIFTASIYVNPENSIISIDGRVYGVGNVNNILLTGGPHKLHVHKDGFKNYDDIIIIHKDGFQKDITLKSLNFKRYIKIVSNPSKAVVFLNENFMGYTPILLKIMSDNDVITITKKGYLDRVIYPRGYKNKTGLEIKLKTATKLERSKISWNNYKRRSKLFYYSGIGFLAITVIMAANSTVFKQEAELYKNSNMARYKDAINKKKIYGALAAVSAFSSGIVFTFSFEDILKYFKKYETGD